MSYDIELPNGVTKAEIAGIVATWNYLNTEVENGNMPDVPMDITTTDDIFTDRWFRIANANYCITNEEGEKPHLADVIELYDIDDELFEGYTVDDLKKCL